MRLLVQLIFTSQNEIRPPLIPQIMPAGMAGLYKATRRNNQKKNQSKIRAHILEEFKKRPSP